VDLQVSLPEVQWNSICNRIGLCERFEFRRGSKKIRTSEAQTRLSKTTQRERLQPPRWHERIRALHSVPPLFRMVWESAPLAVVSALSLRLITALIPLAMLAVTRYIIDAIVAVRSQHTSLPHTFWWLVVLEFGLACLGTILGRFIDFSDTYLADKFTRYISTKIMEHAAKLDLTRYEDPLFWDKMERARVQGTDRVMMIQMAGRLFQQAITTMSLAAGVVFFSPWLMLFLFACVCRRF
jgi:ATP-binding cassette subfamily B protein